ncbi:sugar phosphate isomerase/epimerase family protein [Halostagnicola bangensis]
MARKTRKQDSQDGDDFSVKRRQVLQGIGATGVASAVMTGSVHGGTNSRNIRRVQADLEELDQEREIPTSSQFFSFNELEGYSNADLIHLSADAGLDSYEPFMIDDADAMLEAQNETGLYMSSAHVGIDDIEDDPEGMAETYEQFAVDGRNPSLIEPAIRNEWDTEESVIELAERINAAADLMAEHDFEFGYHNHDFEFEYLDDADERAYDVFIENIEDHVYIQLDVAWVYAGVDRPDPLNYIIEHGDKIKSLHMKNWSEADDALTEIHEGDLNQRAIATAARRASQVDHLVYEYDNSPQPYDSFEYAGEWLNRINHPWDPAGIPGIPDADTHPAKLAD